MQNSTAKPMEIRKLTTKTALISILNPGNTKLESQMRLHIFVLMRLMIMIKKKATYQLNKH